MCWSFQMVAGNASRGDGQGGDRRRLEAKHARTEREGSSVVAEEELALLFGETAFRSEEKDDRRLGVRRSAKPRLGLGMQHDAKRRLRQRREEASEVGRRVDPRLARASTLL